MNISPHSVNDGEARYASRTRVNRLVLDYNGAEGLGNTNSASLTAHINGQIQTIYIDCTGGRLSANGDAETVMGTLTLTNGDYTCVNGTPMYLCSPVTGLDLTNKSTANSGIIAERTYMLQTKEGSDSTNMLLDAYSMQSGHTTPCFAFNGRAGCNRRRRSRYRPRYNWSHTTMDRARSGQGRIYS